MDLNLLRTKVIIYNASTKVNVNNLNISNKSFPPRASRVGERMGECPGQCIMECGQTEHSSEFGKTLETRCCK